MANSKSNFPSNQLKKLENEPGQFCSSTCLDLLGGTKIAARKGKLEDDEAELIVNEYIQDCIDKNLRPGIETLCFRLNVNPQTLTNWTKGIGCSERRQELACNIKQFIIAFLEQASLQGKLNPANSIFYLKNWAGYRDQIDLANATVDSNDRPKSIEQIQEQYKTIGIRQSDLSGNEPPKPEF